MSLVVIDYNSVGYHQHHGRYAHLLTSYSYICCGQCHFHEAFCLSPSLFSSRPVQRTLAPAVRGSPEPPSTSAWQRLTEWRCQRRTPSHPVRIYNAITLFPSRRRDSYPSPAPSVTRRQQRLIPPGEIRNGNARILIARRSHFCQRCLKRPNLEALGPPSMARSDLFHVGDTRPY